MSLQFRFWRGVSGLSLLVVTLLLSGCGTGSEKKAEESAVVDTVAEVPMTQEDRYGSITVGNRRFHVMSVKFTEINGQLNVFAALDSVGRPIGSVDFRLAPTKVMPKSYGLGPKSTHLGQVSYTTGRGAGAVTEQRAYYLAGDSVRLEEKDGARTLRFEGLRQSDLKGVAVRGGLPASGELHE